MCTIRIISVGSSIDYSVWSKNDKMVYIFRHRESNPGLPRDRRGY